MDNFNFGALKRRTTDLMNSIPSMPSSTSATEPSSTASGLPEESESAATSKPANTEDTFSFGALKRRGTDLINSIPKPNLPSMPGSSIPEGPEDAATKKANEDPFMFGALKRRGTNLVASLPKPNMPNMPDLSGLPTLPNMPALPTKGGYTKPVVKATWERIGVPPLPRSSHTIDIISGTAYIFGGEIEPRKPVDNDIHAITLPFSSAGADYYPIKAKAAKPKIPTIAEPTIHDEDEEEGLTEKQIEAEDNGKGKEKDLDEIPLASPTPAEGAEEEIVSAASQINDGPEPRLNKGKERAVPDLDLSNLGDVPCARVGHATAVIGNRIFLFGGRGGPDLKPLEEGGRIWVFDTKTHLWSHLDAQLPYAEPLSPAIAGTKANYPAARSYHSAVSTDQPRDFTSKKPSLKRAGTWTQWAQGDSDVVGTPQQPIVGNIANNSRDEDDDGYGTFIIHGGCYVEGRANDTWAFDVRSRVWQELPAAPGKPRGGTSIAICKSRLYRFGGFNGETEEGGQLDYLELGVDSFNDQSGDADVVLSARGQWKSLIQGQEATAPAVSEKHDAAAPLKQLADPEEWPGYRSVAGMEAINAGGGREYIVLMLGERDPSNAGHEAAGKFWNDIWAFQVPLKHEATAASVSDTMWGMFGKSKAGEGKWFKVETEAYDDDDDGAELGPGPRGWFATAPMGELEERGIVIWGGLDDRNARQGDGWILRVGSEKREA